MKITSENKRTRKSIITVGVVAIIAISTSVLAWQLGYFGGNSEGTPPTTEVTEKQYQDSKNDKTDKSNGTTSTDLPSKQAPSTQPAEPTGSDSTTIDGSIQTPKIERASQSGDSVKLVAGFPTPQSGTCEVTFSKNGQPSLVYKSAITVSPSNYSCSFVVPVTNFSTSGTWTLNVIQRIGDRSSSASTTNIEVAK